MHTEILVLEKQVLQWQGSVLLYICLKYAGTEFMWIFF